MGLGSPCPPVSRLRNPQVAAMQTQAQLTRNTISLKGSAQLVAEFFDYAVNK